MSTGELILGVLDTTQKMDSLKLSMKCRDFTISCSRFDYFGHVIEASSVDEILERASRTDADHCLVQAYGHVSIRYRDAERGIVTNFVKAVREWASEHDFVVAGRIVGGGEDGWYGLDDLCFLVSLAEYRALGKPSFHPGDGPERLPATTEERAENSEGSPLRALHPAAGEITAEPRSPGWRLIAASLERGKPVRDFDDLLYRCRYDLRVEPEEEATVTAYLGDGIFDYTSGESEGLSEDWRGFLDFVKDQAKHAKRGVFLGNWEGYGDVEEPPEGFRGPVSNVYGVAAGFKPNRILETHGFSEDTRVVFFDYSEVALGLREALVTEWDGTDFPGFIESVAGRFPDAFYQLWGNAEPGALDLDLVADRWQTELGLWGGDAAFREHWSRYRELRHRFVPCDLFADPAPLLEAIEPGPGSVMWWSNAFHSLNGVWFYHFEKRQLLYRRWLHAVAAADPGLWIYGTDVDNRGIFGEPIGKLAEERRLGR